VYGRVWIDGVTNQPGPTIGLLAQLGYGPEGSTSNGNSVWKWVEASFNVDVENDDEYVAQLYPQEVGTFNYVYRYSTDNGLSWLYADLNGPFTGTPPNPGKLTVNSSGDTTPPAVPTGLNVVTASNTSVELAWNAHPDTDSDLAGFEVYRDGNLLATLFDASATGYTDNSVSEGNPYEYYIKAFDTSWNRSSASNTVTVTAERRTVTVTFNVTVPDITPSESTVYIAGTLSALDGNLPDWDPMGVALTKVSDTVWSIILSGPEGTPIEYKYTLGSWEFVEKGANCEELDNRTLRLDYGSDGTMEVNDTVLNWRNVAPCGN
ncbi:MAG: alpha-amylase, partial [Chloroflexota bacterium]|nr:alpha-amylase [Chloroflexota bacterium]